MKSSHKRAILVIAMCIWFCCQMKWIGNHSNTHHNTINPHHFVKHFHLLPFYRTNIHEKTNEYWWDWLRSNDNHLLHNSNLILFHFDTHANSDITTASIHTCSPAQLMFYDQLVAEVLSEAMDWIIAETEPTTNVTQLAMEKGYINKVVWVYPSHWTRYASHDTTQFIWDINYDLFRNEIKHQTFYIEILSNGSYEYYHFIDNDTTPLSQHFWKTLFNETMSAIAYHPLNDRFLKIEIFAAPLSEIQSLLPSITDNTSQIIFDLDLDYIMCWEPSDMLLNHFEWNTSLVEKLNSRLRHSQYTTEHMPIHTSNDALITLLYHLSNGRKLKRSATDQLWKADLQSSDIQRQKPTIKDAIQTAIDNRLDIASLRQILDHLFRYQLEISGIGKSTFIQPLESFIFTHSRIDEIAESVSDMDRSAPLGGIPFISLSQRNQSYSAAFLSQQRLDWYHNISLKMGHPLSSQLRNVEINSDGSIQSPIDSADEIDQLLEQYSAVLKLELNVSINASDWIGTVHNYSFINTSDIPLSDELIFTVLQSHFDTILEKGLLHKANQPSMIEYLTKLSNLIDHDEIKLINHLNSTESQLWHSGHSEFHRKLRDFLLNDNNIEFYHPLHHESLSYQQSLDILDLGSNYRFENWSRLIETETDDNWKHLYSDLHSSVESINNDSSVDIELEMHHLPNMTDWNTLDPIQKHFLKQSDHSALEELIASMSDKQKQFLRWLLFCYYASHRCENGVTPLSEADISELGETQPWQHIETLPSLISSADHNGILQFSIVNHNLESMSPFETPFHDIKRHTHNHMPSLTEIQNIIRDILRFIRMINGNIEAGGIELSPIHIPNKYKQWIECQLMYNLEQLFTNEFNTFIRYQTFETDSNANTPHCVRDLMYRFDSYVDSTDIIEKIEAKWHNKKQRFVSLASETEKHFNF